MSHISLPQERIYDISQIAGKTIIIHALNKSVQMYIRQKGSDEQSNTDKAIISDYMSHLQAGEKINK